MARDAAPERREARDDLDARVFKVRDLHKEFKAFVDLLARHILQTLRPEALYSERPHDTAVEHRRTENRRSKHRLRSKIPVKSAGERIPPLPLGRPPLPAAAQGARNGREILVPSLNERSPKKAVAPYSPCFTIRVFGPIASTFSAASTRLRSPASIRASPSLISSTSSSRSTFARFAA